MSLPPPINPVDPGIKTLWILQFKPESKQVDFFIPSPFDKNQWFNASPAQHDKAQAMMTQIHQACEEIKKECKDTKQLSTLEEYLKKTKDLCTGIKNIDELVKNFNAFFRRLQQKPPKEDESPNEPPKE